MLLQSELSGFQLYGGGRRPLAFVTSPVFDEGRVIGVLALGLGPERIWQVLSDLSGLGRTGEIVTGEQQGQSVLVTCPLRHAPDAAFKLQIPLGGEKGVATQKAASGSRGYGLVRDYRGEDVVAAMEEGAEGGIIGDLLFTTRTELCKNHRDGNLT
jgi:hypothetical protein